MNTCIKNKNLGTRVIYSLVCFYEFILKQKKQYEFILNQKKLAFNKSPNSFKDTFSEDR